MDDIQFYIHFKSISVISEQWVGDNDRLSAMESCLWLKRSPPQPRLKPGTTRLVGQHLSYLDTSNLNKNLIKVSGINFQIVKYILYSLREESKRENKISILSLQGSCEYKNNPQFQIFLNKTYEIHKLPDYVTKFPDFSAFNL